MKKQKKVEKSMVFKKYYFSEFQLHDGEVFITFNIVAIDTSKNEIPVAVSNSSFRPAGMECVPPPPSTCI